MTPERLQEIKDCGRIGSKLAYSVAVDELLAELERLESLCRAQLFVGGQITLHSGEVSDFKIDCDALTDAEIAVLAKQLAKRLKPFSAVQGIPRGGLRLAEAIKPYIAESGPFLIVDDVLTTGSSMEAARHGTDEIGAVLFARGPCPSWITPLFQLDAKQQIAELIERCRIQEEKIAGEKYLTNSAIEETRRQCLAKQSAEKRIADLDAELTTTKQRLDSYICRAEQDLEPKLKATKEELLRLRTGITEIFQVARAYSDYVPMTQVRAIAEELLKPAAVTT